MVYDSTRAKCVHLAGTPGSHTLDKVEILDDCVSHASHDIIDFCICDPGFHETLKGTCEKEQLGKPCSRHDDTCSQSHFTCGPTGTCDCDNATSVFDSDRKACVIKTA